MIAFIRGKVAAYGADWVIIDHDGMGWKIAYPHTDALTLNGEVQIYTYLHLTENDISLFGFESREEQELFLRLISVKGLGPKTAMGMLAKAGYREIVSAVEQGNVAALKKMPGIGAKSASQIVLDLKGKLVPAETAGTAAKPSYPREIEDALNGLKGLGYKPSELNGVQDYMLQQPGKTTEQYLKLGLQYLLKNRIGG